MRFENQAFASPPKIRSPLNGAGISWRFGFYKNIARLVKAFRWRGLMSAARVEGDIRRISRAGALVNIGLKYVDKVNRVG